MSYKKTYYIFRHGETFVTKSHGLLSYGFQYFSAPLQVTGIASVTQIGKYLEDQQIDSFVSSEYLRCRETSQIVSKIIHKEYTVDKRLNSIFFETPWQVKKRVEKLLKEIEKAEEQHIALCTHGFIISVLVSLLLSKSLHPIDMIRQIKPGILVIISERKMELVNFNR